MQTDCLQVIIAEVAENTNIEKVKAIAKYFKCYEGGYGFGDTFIGVSNPVLRQLAKKYKNISIENAFSLLQNKVHEIRLLALYILTIKYSFYKTTVEQKSLITKLYLQNLQYVNNWDLVDSSAHKLLGPAINNNNIDILIQFTRDKSMWVNRVAMLATFYHIGQKKFDIPLQIANLLIDNKHDIVHKAVGWGLREIGKRDINTEIAFLNTNYKVMPRTMLRYAIEKFDEKLRVQYLKGLI